MGLKKIIYFFGVKILFHPRFILDFYKFRSLQKNNKKKIEWKDVLPFFNENTTETIFDSHYVYHPAWATRVVKKINPEKHIDISSTLHFCTQLSAFIPTDFYDYRPAQLKLDNLTTNSIDLCKMNFESNSIYSLSCMHTIEHIGLGRYGDPLDPYADIQAASELQRVIAEKGNLLIVTPVGRPKIMFNGHRIYSFEQIIGMFSQLTLVEFTLIPDNAISAGMVANANPDLVSLQKYGCGC